MRRIRRPSKGLLGRLLTEKRADWRRKRTKKQNGMCHWCGNVMTNPTLDHVIPLSKGGEDHWENVVAACGRCNQKKANKLPGEFA